MTGNFSSKNTVIITALTVFSVLSFSPALFALSEDQRRYFDSGYDYVNVLPTKLCSTQSVDYLVGSNNAETAYSYFLGKGFSPEQASGLVGNFQVESGVDPTRAENNDGPSFGMAQWKSPRLDRLYEFADALSVDPLSLLTQLDFVMFEFTGIPEAPGLSGKTENKAYNDLLSRDNVEEAAVSVAMRYERNESSLLYIGDKGTNPPSVITSPTYAEVFGDRIREAENVFAAFGDNTYSTVTGLNNCVVPAGLAFDDPFYNANPDVYIDGASECLSGPLQPGLDELRNYVLKRWAPYVTHVTPVAVCKGIVGNETVVSVHSEGRAIDVNVDASNPPAKIVGDEIRDWFLLNSTNLGGQRVIWNRYVWSANRDGLRLYWTQGSKRHPHDDHLHLELNWDGSLMLTPFFTSGVGK